MTDEGTQRMSAQIEPQVEKIEIYKAHCARASAAIEHLYKLPPVFATVIGGLWFFATQQLATHRFLSVAIFLFAACVALVGDVSFRRIRDAMNGYLDSIALFEGHHAFSMKAGPKGMSVARAFAWLMTLSYGLSLIAAAYAAVGL